MSIYDPSGTGLKVQGLREVNRALKAVGAPAEEVKKAGKQSADAVVRKSLTLVPVRSGKLRNSIRSSATARGRISVIAGNNRKSKSGIPYANPIHWGWFKRNILPNPFFAKALGYTREEVYQNYFKQLDRLIQRQKGINQ